MKAVYQKFRTLFGRIPQDKLIHFVLGMAIFFIIFSSAGPFFMQNPLVLRGIALFFVLIISLAKEYLIGEGWIKGKPDLLDAYATDLGGVFALMISLLVC